jgi:hypothetical protein
MFGDFLSLEKIEVSVVFVQGINCWSRCIFFLLAHFQTSFFFDQPSRTASWHSELTLATTETMAEYAPTGAPGAGSNGPNMNGSTDPNYAAQAPLPSSSEAAKTLW